MKMQKKGISLLLAAALAISCACCVSAAYSDLKFSGLLFTQGDGTEISDPSLLSENGLRTSVDAENTSAESMWITLTAVLKKTDGSVVECDTDRVYISSADGKQTLETTLTLEEMTAGDYAEVYLWDDFEKMYPLTEKIVFSLSEGEILSGGQEMTELVINKNILSSEVSNVVAVKDPNTGIINVTGNVNNHDCVFVKLVNSSNEVVYLNQIRCANNTFTAECKVADLPNDVYTVYVQSVSLTPPLSEISITKMLLSESITDVTAVGDVDNHTVTVSGTAASGKNVFVKLVDNIGNTIYLNQTKCDSNGDFSIVCKSRSIGISRYTVYVMCD